MRKREQMAVAVFAALVLVLLDAATFTAWWRVGLTFNAIFRMFIIALFVLPGAMLAWRLREGTNLKSWATIAARYWLTAGAVVVLCVQSGLYKYLSHATTWHTIQQTIFTAALGLPFGMFFLYWLTSEERTQAPYPIRSVRRRIQGKATLVIPFVSSMGTRAIPTRAFSGNRFRVKRKGLPLVRE